MLWVLWVNKESIIISFDLFLIHLELEHSHLDNIFPVVRHGVGEVHQIIQVHRIVESLNYYI